MWGPGLHTGRRRGDLCLSDTRRTGGGTVVGPLSVHTGGFGWGANWPGQLLLRLKGNCFPVRRRGLPGPHGRPHPAFCSRELQPPTGQCHSGASGPAFWLSRLPAESLPSGMVPAVEAATSPSTCCGARTPRPRRAVVLAAVLSGSATMAPSMPPCQGPVPSPAWLLGKYLPLPQLLRPRFWDAAALRPLLMSPLGWE